MDIVLDPDIATVLEAFNAHPFIRFETMTPVQAREVLAELFEPVLQPPVARIEDVSIPAVVNSDRAIPARLYHPAPGQTLPLVVFFHGGGWVWGSPEKSEAGCRLLAASGNVAVLSVDYRLAPEHPFPAAVEDAETATRWALAHGAEFDVDVTRVGVAGDSAGGNLAAVVSQLLRDHPGSGSRLKAQFLIYPAVDGDSDRPSMGAYATGYLLERVHMGWFIGHYVPDPADREDPRFAPLRAESLAGLPPAVVLLPEVDILRDEGDAYAVALQGAGVHAELLVAEGMIHGFISFWPVSPAARREYETGIRRFAALLRADT